MPFLTIAGENKIALNQSVNGGLTIVNFVLANVPDLGAEPADRIAVMPDPSLIVDTLPFTKRGYVNPNQVVYSLVMGSNLGDYDFNWIGLVDEDGVLVVVSHVPNIQKRKSVGGVPGNTITRNFLIEYTDIQNITATTVPVETWQIDFSDRLGGIDERERLSNLDIYGHEGFLGDGWKVTGAAGTYNVAAGIGYVGGVRVKNDSAKEVTTATFPNEIWLNVSLQGDISDMAAVGEFVIDVGPFADYTDSNGIAHYLTKIADLNAASAVTEARSIFEVASKDHSENAENLSKGRVPDARLSGSYDMHAASAGKFSSDVGLLFTDVNSAYFSNNVSEDRYKRIGDGYASRIWLDRAAGGIKIQHGGYGLAGTVISWIDSLTIDGRGSVTQFVGMVASFPSLVTPLGWLKLQGGEVSRSSYLSLFEFAVASGNMAESEAAKDLGQFGPGDGSTTFTLPDPQGMTIRTLDEAGSIESGREIGSYQADQVKSHTHEYDTMQGSGITNSVSDYVATTSNTSAATGKTTGATGGTENTVKNIAWPLYIKY